MTDFPTLLVTWSLQKGTPFGRSLLVYMVIISVHVYEGTELICVKYHENNIFFR